MIRLILTFALALVSAAAALGEGVSVAPTLTPGRSMVYDVSFTLERTLSLGAGRDRLVQEAGLAMTIESVDDAGVATIAGRFDWIILDLDRASFRVRVDSRDIVGDSPNKAETTVRELIAKYLESTFTLRVDAEGNVLEFTGLEPVTEYAGGQDGTLTRLVAGRFLPGTMGGDLEPIWRADGSVGMTLSAGDTWNAVRTSPVMGPVGIKLETPYTVEKAEKGELTASGDVAISIEIAEEIDLPITFTLEDAGGEASIAWDGNAGALRSRQASTKYTMILEVEGEKQGSQRSAESSIELVSLSEAGEASEGR